MGFLNASFQGIEALVGKLNSLAEALPNALNAASAQVASVAFQELQARTPVDTGNLKASEYIDQQQDGSYYVSVDLSQAYYGIFVEYGFHHWISGKFIEGQHYVEGAALATQPQLINIFQNAIHTLFS